MPNFCFPKMFRKLLFELPDSSHFSPLSSSSFLYFCSSTTSYTKTCSTCSASASAAVQCGQEVGDTSSGTLGRHVAHDCVTAAPGRYVRLPTPVCECVPGSSVQTGWGWEGHVRLSQSGGCSFPRGALFTTSREEELPPAGAAGKSRSGAKEKKRKGEKERDREM